MSKNNVKGALTLQITDDIIKEVRAQARLASGLEKYEIYKKLRIFELHRGKWLVKLG